MIRHQKQRRDGAAMVEFAVVATVFFLIVFGIFEFAYLIMVNNLLTNAAREGARYATVNTPQGSALTANIQNVVDARLAAISSRFVGYNKTTSITVTALNPVTGAVAVDSNGNTVNPWDTAFGQYIQVQVTVTYKPMLPSLVHIPSSFTLVGSAVTNSESN
jgi:Flp pilus assembly protein TadG